jgi:hypothetical protein
MVSIIVRCEGSSFGNRKRWLIAKRSLEAFSSDPEWIETRRKSEEEGPIDASIINTILMPNALWIAMCIARRLHARVCDPGWTFSFKSAYAPSIGDRFLPE